MLPSPIVVCSKFSGSPQRPRPPRSERPARMIVGRCAKGLPGASRKHPRGCYRDVRDENVWGSEVAGWKARCPYLMLSRANARARKARRPLEKEGKTTWRESASLKVADLGRANAAKRGTWENSTVPRGQVRSTQWPVASWPQQQSFRI